MSAKFTKGPWIITQRPDHAEIHGDAGDELVCELPYINGNESANARLIAACPTMADYVIKQALAGDKDAQVIAKSFGWDAT